MGAEGERKERTKTKQKPRKKEMNGKINSKQRLNRKEHSDFMCSLQHTTDGHSLTEVSAMVKTNILLNSVII